MAAFEALSAQDELSDSDDSEGLPPMAGPGTADVRDTPLRQDDHEDNFAADGEGEECDDDNLEQEEADSPGTDDSPQARRRRTRRRIRMRKKARAQEDAEKKAAEEKAMVRTRRWWKSLLLACLPLTCGLFLHRSRPHVVLCSHSWKPQ